MRVLVIEDNSDIVANLNAYLGPRGYSLDFAVNGYAACLWLRTIRRSGA